MEQYLYDVQGYAMKIEITKTINLSKAGISQDTRELGVFFHYIGPVKSEYEKLFYENDKFVISRLEFPYQGEWNHLALKGFHGPETSGTWAGPVNLIHLKDAGIRKSGLKLEYMVPDFILPCHSRMRIYVNEVLVKDILLEQAGRHTEILDVSEIGRDEREYLEHAHGILKTLLQEFDRVCQKYDLHYYLICGSLLGAVRHGDLIPWDDDVDVAMPRKDFDKLLECVELEWGNSCDFQFLNYDQMGNGAFLDYMTRLVYMKETIPVNIYRKIKGKGREDVDNHLPIDIYVLDNASNNEKIHQLQTFMIQGLYGLAMGHRAYIKEEDYKNRDAETQKKVKIVSSIGKHIPLAWIFACYEWVRKWNKNKKCENYFESNGFIYCIPWKFEQKWFGEGSRLQLGEVSVNVPKDYEAFLRKHYSDFNQYPPMEVRKPTHSVEASGIF